MNINATTAKRKIAKQITRARMLKGMSVKDLAQAIGVTQSSINQLENEDFIDDPGIILLTRVCHELNIELNQLGQLIEE